MLWLYFAHFFLNEVMKLKIKDSGENLVVKQVRASEKNFFKAFAMQIKAI